MLFIKIYWKNAFFALFSEPVELIGEGKYNLNAVKEIKVTESFLGLDQDVRVCQNEEELDRCTTRHYKETILAQCHCMPLKLGIAKNMQVNKHTINININHNWVYRIKPKIDFHKYKEYFFNLGKVNLYYLWISTSRGMHNAASHKR